MNAPLDKKALLSEADTRKAERIAAVRAARKCQAAARSHRAGVQQGRATQPPQRALVGREVIKTGMTASLAATVLTGYRILRPMRLHPVAGAIFLGFSLAHLLLNDKRPRR